MKHFAVILAPIFIGAVTLQWGISPQEIKTLDKGKLVVISQGYEGEEWGVRVFRTYYSHPDKGLGAIRIVPAVSLSQEQIATSFQTILQELKDEYATPNVEQNNYTKWETDSTMIEAILTESSWQVWFTSKEIEL